MVYRTYGNSRGRRGGFRWTILIVFGVIAAVYYFANLKTVPYTGRKQVRTMSEDQEMQLGYLSYQEVLSENSQNLVMGGEAYDTIQQVGIELARAAAPEDPGFDWQFNLIRSEQANAFALPGGYVAIYTGILPIAENDDGLAVIMGHEIAHALAHHGAERMAQQNLERIVGTGVALGAGGMSGPAQQTVLNVFGGISQYGYALPFSRKHETEADQIGLILVARACYDPREAPYLWERMEQQGGAAPPEFASTHPAPEHRVKNFQEWMPAAIDLYNENCPTKIRTEDMSAEPGRDSAGADYNNRAEDAADVDDAADIDDAEDINDIDDADMAGDTPPDDQDSGE